MGFFFIVMLCGIGLFIRKNRQYAEYVRGMLAQGKSPSDPRYATRALLIPTGILDLRRAR
jgi:hypothetical protein